MVYGQRMIARLGWGLELQLWEARQEEVLLRSYSYVFGADRYAVAALSYSNNDEGIL